MSCYVLLGEEHAMPTYGTTDRVRQQAAKEYIEPARRAGVKHVHIHSGTFNKRLVESHVLPPNRLPLICNALASRKFQRENHLALENVEGPPSGHSSTVIYTYRLEPLPSAPDSTSPAASSNFLSLRGVLKDTYKQLGGAERFHKSQREAWDR
jgi:hypothetical protein